MGVIKEIIWQRQETVRQFKQELCKDKTRVSLS